MDAADACCLVAAVVGLCCTPSESRSIPASSVLASV